jgi:8-oxo-dGTP pyrophosphatase MutT (NUDIX family)
MGLPMPLSPYVRSLRERVGQDLLLPGVTAVIREEDRFLLARQRDTERWSLIGGGIEPGETPHDAVVREVIEELGVTPSIGAIVGAYGGDALQTTLPNGDLVAYV